MKSEKRKNWAGLLFLLVPLFAIILLAGFSPVGSILIYVFLFGIPLVILYSGIKSKKVLSGLNLAVSASLVLSAGFFSYFMNVYTQLPFGFSLLLFFVLALTNIIAIFFNWREYHIKSLIPVGITAVTIPLMMVANGIGKYAEEAVFLRRLPQYEKAVKMVERKMATGDVTLYWDDIPEEYSHLAYHIAGERLGDNRTAVTFTWASGFPVKHIAYTYISDGQMPEPGSAFRKKWHRGTRINEKWFRVID